MIQVARLFSLLTEELKAPRGGGRAEEKHMRLSESD